MSVRGQGFLCTKCARYVSHDIFICLGYCREKDQIVPLAEDVCDKFEAVDIERAIKEKGWIHCLTCKMPVYSVESLEGHIGHVLAAEIYGDGVASEEAPSAD
ncbi:MAG: hypothetical protein ACUVQ8_06320 [Nitrososphaeria archaeon]